MLDSIRSFFNPLFESDRDELALRFLYTIIASVIAMIVCLVALHVLDGGGLFSKTTIILLGLLAVQILFMFMTRRGHVTLTAGLFVTSGWLGVTYQAWHADGVRDTAIFVYMVIILIAALVVGWRLSLVLSGLSLVVIWAFAILETRGLRPVHLDSPMHVARDLTAIFLLQIVLVFLLVNTLRQTLQKIKDDFTARAQVQQALLKSEERFYKIFQTSPVAIVITNLEDGRIVDANPAYWKLSGHDPKLSMGRTAFDLRPDLKQETRLKFIKELAEKKSIHDPAYDFINEKGEHLNTIAFYELIEMDGRSAILSMFYDVSEQSKSRDALRQSEMRLRAMLEAVPDMILELRRNGTIAHIVPSASDDLIVEPAEFLGKNITEVLPMAADQAKFVIDRALASGQVNAFEYRMKIGGEEKTFEARITPVADDLVLAIVRDVTLQKWAMSERESLIDELEMKNAELERFTYTVSHDLKSPLITIKGFLGFVREDARAGNISRLEKDIQRIGDATDKMQRLLADLLELSRVGRLASTPKPIATNELIAEVKELLHGRIAAGKISVQVADNLPSIYGDRQRIFEVFQNLIDNAAKFMGDQPAPCIDIGVHGELKGNPIFFVRDNGIGIAPQFKEKIFGLFDKLNAQSEGTGIGLALVKRIVEYHGGVIWVDSESGKGATFFFSLPTQPKIER
jgi:PAS domain S-box-containing protein